MTLFLVRHAHAGRRGEWARPDGERPLSDKGRHQVEAITAFLSDRTVSRVLSSSAVRCVQTVEPLAQVRGIGVDIDAALTEGTRTDTTTNLLWGLASEGIDAVLSSHGDVIPAALDALRRDGVDVEDGYALPKGTLYELDVVDGAIRSARFHDPRP